MYEGEEVPLAAYTDRLSGRPGDKIKFYVSSQQQQNEKQTDDEDDIVTARLVRSICCDPNPMGPGVIETDASQYFFPSSSSSSSSKQQQQPPVTFKVQYQPIKAGSYAKSQQRIQLFAPTTKDHSTTFNIEIWIYPTTSFPYQTHQNIWVWGGLGTYLNPQGCIEVVNIPKGSSSSVVEQQTTTTTIISSTDTPLKSHKWYHVNFEVDVTKNTCTLTIQKESGDIHLTKSSSSSDVDCFKKSIDDYFWLAFGGSFNGKLESPMIKFDNGNNILAHWDLSQNMSDQIVLPSCNTKNTPPLILYNYPMRGVKGRLWDGTEYFWKHKPSHYGAIYFHDDDCYDFQWKSTFEWTIPSEIPSGIYIVRLRSQQHGTEEALPLFICPPAINSRNGDYDSAAIPEKTKKKDKVCILVSTFTYVMYGNHTRDDFDEDAWMDKVKAWGGYPYNPQQYKKYGLSTYNHHKSDGTGICFASHRRPLFNLRPQYLTFGNNKPPCSGLRHLPADSHLIAWMHHHGIDYDIVTDHELHNAGVTAISGYNTIVTGTHPEYHTVESLDALQTFRDKFGGNIAYLGGNGFYWRVTANEEAGILEIRRAEGGIRTWAAEPGEYYHTIDGGSYGGLWRNNNRAPQKLVGVGFTAQGIFDSGMSYSRKYFDDKLSWIFDGIDNSKPALGDYGYSGNGAAGFELDRIDHRLQGEGDDENIVILAQAMDTRKEYMFVPEDILTTYSNLSGMSEDDSRRADMIYFKTASGAQIFSVGSITFCGSLPWNNFDNDISRILLNVIKKFVNSK